MQYKKIYSAIGNFGSSFTSLMNYIDSDYVIDELSKIHSKGYDIHIDWLNNKFEPQQLLTPRITKSIGYYASKLSDHLKSENVDIEKLTLLKFTWPSSGRKFMYAKDDRDKVYKIYVNEIK